jgi:putative transposase
MPRRELAQAANVIFHVCNRSARRLLLFESPNDYLAFLNTLEEAKRRVPLELMAYCVMPNHFHLIVRPRVIGQLPAFMQWFQFTHSKRWRVFRGTSGEGAVYQGRYRAIPIQDDHHFLVACRYVEANAFRSRLVSRVEHWPWSSFCERIKRYQRVTLDPWPIPPPANWSALLNDQRQNPELLRLRKAVQKNVPFGGSAWMETFAASQGNERGLEAEDTG